MITGLPFESLTKTFAEEPLILLMTYRNQYGVNEREVKGDVIAFFAMIERVEVVLADVDDVCRPNIGSFEFADCPKAVLMYPPPLLTNASTL